MGPRIVFFSLLFLLSLCSSTINGSDCVYTLYISTGNVYAAGTNSIIGLSLYDTYGSVVKFENLETWGGLMGQNHNYFEIGNMDIFSGKGKCLNEAICAMNLTSDGSGIYPGWFANYVEVSTTGLGDKPCYKQLFKVNQWLDVNQSPNKLWAAMDYCSQAQAQTQAHLKSTIDGTIGSGFASVL